ncbi:MAG: tRNA (N6-isopentenyl adenosine(37)-C2)-methylthiotransferase MiaB [bacterium]|nr:tRNA (N6-isopentenyl adenosine(37)-C2)-methylthiotransferase MiaB [bacterium]
MFITEHLYQVTLDGRDKQQIIILPMCESERRSRSGCYIKTYGCQMNEYDSEKVMASLAETHYPVAEIEDADVVIINTCSVREKAEHKLFSLLGTLKAAKENNPNLVVGVGGCVAQQEGQAILRKSPVVDFVYGTHNISLVPSLVSRALHSPHPQVAVDYREEWEDLPDEFVPLVRPGEERTLPLRALIAIQRGCNKNCAFCVVPTTRGPEVSRSAEEILREIRIKVSSGSREIMLLGQTVNSYGKDLSPRVRFEDLIKRVSDIPGVERIRFTSPHPQDVRKEFVDLFDSVPQLCPHIHLPLQSGSNRILKLMNRNYSRERYLEIIGLLQERRPDIAISTDIIVGFPGETDIDFQDTLQMVEDVKFHMSYAFMYSPRPNTVSKATMREEQVPSDISSARLQILQGVQDRLCKEQNEAWLDKEVEVLLEDQGRHSSGALRGRTRHNVLAEISGEGMKIGDTVRARVSFAGPYGIRGELVENSG